MRRNLIIAALAFTALSIAGCDSSYSSSSSGKTGSMACTHWANIKGDIRDGILNDAEIRAKVSEVRSSASDPAVRSAATDLLAGITGHSTSQMTTAYASLNSACS